MCGGGTAGGGLWHSLTRECQGQGGPGGNSKTTATLGAPLVHQGRDALAIFLHQQNIVHLGIETSMLELTSFSQCLILP